MHVCELRHVILFFWHIIVYLFMRVIQHNIGYYRKWNVYMCACLFVRDCVCVFMHALIKGNRNKGQYIIIGYDVYNVYSIFKRLFVLLRRINCRLHGCLQVISNSIVCSLSVGASNIAPLARKNIYVAPRCIITYVGRGYRYTVALRLCTKHVKLRMLLSLDFLLGCHTI